MVRVYFEIALRVVEYLEVPEGKQFANLKADIITRAQQINSLIETGSPLFMFGRSHDIVLFCEIRSIDESSSSTVFRVVQVETLAQLRDLFPLIGTLSCPLRVGRRIHALPSAAGS